MAKAYIERPKEDTRHRVTISLGEVNGGVPERQVSPHAMLKISTNADDGMLSPKRYSEPYERLMEPGDEITVIIED